MRNGRRMRSPSEASLRIAQRLDPLALPSARRDEVGADRSAAGREVRVRTCNEPEKRFLLFATLQKNIFEYNGRGFGQDVR
jgi:hypothetical protein